MLMSWIIIWCFFFISFHPALHSPSVSPLRVVHGQTQPPKVSLATGIHGPIAGLFVLFQHLPNENQNTSCKMYNRKNIAYFSDTYTWKCILLKMFFTWQSDEGLTFHPSSQQAVNNWRPILCLKPREQRHQLRQRCLCTQVLYTQHLQHTKKIIKSLQTPTWTGSTHSLPSPHA